MVCEILLNLIGPIYHNLNPCSNTVEVNLIYKTACLFPVGLIHLLFKCIILPLHTIRASNGNHKWHTESQLDYRKQVRVFLIHGCRSHWLVVGLNSCMIIMICKEILQTKIKCLSLCHEINIKPRFSVLNVIVS